jgi:hypothetical protein
VFVPPPLGPSSRFLTSTTSSNSHLQDMRDISTPTAHAPCIAARPRRRLGVGQDRVLVTRGSDVLDHLPLHPNPAAASGELLCPPTGQLQNHGAGDPGVWFLCHEFAEHS